MNKFALLLASTSLMLVAGGVSAQLPANPWATTTVQQNSAPRVQDIGLEQARKAKQLRAAQINRASEQLQSRRAENTKKKFDIKSVEVRKEKVALKKSDLADATVAAAEAPMRQNISATTADDGYFGDNVASTDITKAPVYANNSKGSDILPVDPWARARDKSGIKTWRGSGQHGKLNYIGEATTYGDAVGQEMIAPEVNRHNMLVMTQHLRNLGYKIPESYDQGVKDLPKKYTQQLRSAYNSLGHGNNPFDTIFSGLLDATENFTGLDMENILFNSMDLLSTD